MNLTTIFNSGRSRTVDVSEWHPEELNDALVHGIMQLHRTYLLDGEPVHVSTVICGSQGTTKIIADTHDSALQAYWLFDHNGCPCEGAIKQGAWTFRNSKFGKVLDSIEIDNAMINRGFITL